MIDPYVSKHALRRYLERAKGITSPIDGDADALRALQAEGVDLESARREIERATRDAVRVGALLADNGQLRFMLEGRCVKTIIEPIAEPIR
jgi:hypothetical protein